MILTEPVPPPDPGPPASPAASPAPGVAEAAVDLHAVSLAFGPKQVFRDLDLRLEAGRVHALIGPPAVGKSTTLKLIAGLMRPDAGEVHVLGQRIDDLSERALGAVRERMGMLFQNNALFDVSVGENVAFPLRRIDAGLTEATIRARVSERLAKVALAGFEERQPAELSGGQKKRVGLARATVADAALVLYDEPTAGLDPVTSQKIYDLVRGEQRATESTAVVVSSDVAGVLTIADHVAMFYEGRVVFTGSPDEARASRVPVVHQFVHGTLEGPL